MTNNDASENEDTDAGEDTEFTRTTLTEFESDGTEQSSNDNGSDSAASSSTDDAKQDEAEESSAENNDFSDSHSTSDMQSSSAMTDYSSTTASSTDRSPTHSQQSPSNTEITRHTETKNDEQESTEKTLNDDRSDSTDEEVVVNDEDTTTESSVDRNEEGDNAPWENSRRSASQSKGDSGDYSDSRTHSDDDDTVTFGDVNWEFREVGDHYPLEKPYHCNSCLNEHFNSVSGLKTHVEYTHEESWSDYLIDVGLHRCAGCSTPLQSLATLYCESCDRDDSDRIPCRNCGIVRVTIDDPFCSPSCAAERMNAVNASATPFDSPQDAGSDWLDHPHRLPDGIPSAAPFLGNHDLTCRECFEYGSDVIQRVAVHVAERHPDLGWDGYIERYELRKCRVCGDALNSLLPLYCSDECQQSDQNPPRVCDNDGCENAVERRQKYCSRECYFDGKEK